MARQKIPAKRQEDPSATRYVCIGCRRSYTKQRTNFQTAQSLLYRGNNYYLPWCNRCVDTEFERLKNDYGLSDKEATKRLCSKFDMYWNEELFNSMPASIPSSSSVPRQYLRRTNLQQHAGKTFDDTISEEAAKRAAQAQATYLNLEETQTQNTPNVPDELIQKWGPDRPHASYFDLQKRYDELTGGRPVDAATDLLVKQACLSSYEIDQLQKDGKPFEKQQASLVNILGSLNLKPSQIKADERDSGLDSMPLGVGIQRWEQTRPIPEVDDSWKDVDGIKKYLNVWFLGTLCNMVGVENKYSAEYEEELEKYNVTRPDYFEGGDSE